MEIKRLKFINVILYLQYDIVETVLIYVDRLNQISVITSLNQFLRIGIIGLGIAGSALCQVLQNIPM